MVKILVADWDPPYVDRLVYVEADAFRAGLFDELKPFLPRGFTSEIREFYNIDFNTIHLHIRLDNYPNDEYTYVLDRDDLMDGMRPIYHEMGKAAGRYFASLYIQPEPNHILGEE